MSIVGERKDVLVVVEEFVFGINDLDLEINRIEPSLIMAAKVTKGDWVTAPRV